MSQALAGRTLQEPAMRRFLLTLVVALAFAMFAALA
jgi:hypothetical protein